MGIDAGQLDRLMFIGTVSSQNAGAGMVRVVREDKAGKVTAELAVLQRGTATSKDYWMPAVGDQVLCLQLPNFSGKGIGAGFVLGAFYSTVDTPPGGVAASTRVLDHPGDMMLTIGGKLTIKAGTLDISGGGDVVASGISLTGHTHTGVHGETSGPH